MFPRMADGFNSAKTVFRNSRRIVLCAAAEEILAAHGGDHEEESDSADFVV